MADRQTRKARTRAAILEAARDRFVQQGFAGTTIRDVADAAGVGVGTVHAHFADKQGLLSACFDHQIEGAVELGLEAFDEQAPLVDQLAHLARVLFAAYARHPALSREMVAASLFPADGQDPHLGPFLAAIAQRYEDALQAGALTRLPDGGMGAAHGWFALYFLTLIGGLAGAFGDPQAPGAVQVWVAAFRRQLSVQLVGLGANPTLLSSRPVPS